jgi:hypothetical protein
LGAGAGVVVELAAKASGALRITAAAVARMMFFMGVSFGCDIIGAFSQRLWRQVEGVGVDVGRVGGEKHRAGP